MKKQKLLFLISLVSVVSIVGCSKHSGQSSQNSIESSSSETISSSQPSSSNPGPTPIVPLEPDQSMIRVIDNTQKKYPDELLVDRSIVSILLDGEHQIRVLDQFNYTGKNVTFESANPEIATVDENGKITGKQSGETEIIVADKDNPDFSTKVQVIVSPSIGVDDATAVANNLKNANTPKLTKIALEEMYEKAVYKNDIIQRYEREDEKLAVSYDDAYFRIWENDAEIKAENGSVDYTHYEWIFHTNEYFDTNIYHQSGDVKNFMSVPTQDYMSGERITPLLAILDNIFTSGKGLFEQPFRYADASTAAGMVGAEGEEGISNIFYGSLDDDSLLVGLTIRFDDESNQDDETRYGIPCPTKTVAFQSMRFIVKDGVVLSTDIHIDETYEIDGDAYHEVYNIVYNYHDFTDESLYLPDLKDYTIADSIYDV